VDLFDVVKSCIRRWHVFLPIILVAGLASILIFVLMKPTYYCNMVIGFTLPPTQVQSAAPGSAGVPRNGLMDLGGAVMITNIVTASLNERSVRNTVVADGGQDNYEAKMFPIPASGEQIPLITVEASEPDPASASKTVELAAAQAGPATQQLQQKASVPEDQMVQPVVASPLSPPEQQSKGKLKAAIATLMLGVALAVLAAVIVDAMVMRRNARDDSRRPASKDDLPQPMSKRTRNGTDIGGESTTRSATWKAPSRNVHFAGEETVTSRRRR
jgi:hypothetical protein